MSTPILKMLAREGEPLPRLGRYQLVGRLAMGGMAQVYVARHGELSGFQTLVVVKRILPHLVMSADFTGMFLDEARIAARLDHPNVVRIFEVGRAGDEYFLAMELIQGRALSALLKGAQRLGRPLPHPVAAFIVAQAAAGLHHAHTLADPDGTPLNVVHRDVSPHNVLLSFEGAVKVIDFGIARAFGRTTQTGAGDMKGKLGYMSPEQARAEAVDARSDVFALGVVLWECLAGRPLFDRETSYATMQAIVERPYPKPSDFVQVSPMLEQITMRALEKDPALRFQSARDMAAALEQYVFRTGVVTMANVATAVNQVFPDEQARWKQMMKVALEVGQEVERGPTAVVPAPLAASEPALDLPIFVHDRAEPGNADDTTALDNPLRARSPSGRAQALEARSRRRGRRVLGGLAVAAALALTGWRLGVGRGLTIASGASKPEPSSAASEASPPLPNARLAPAPSGAAPEPAPALAEVRPSANARAPEPSPVIPIANDVGTHAAPASPGVPEGRAVRPRAGASKHRAPRPRSRTSDLKPNPF